MTSGLYIIRLTRYNAIVSWNPVSIVVVDNSNLKQPKNRYYFTVFGLIYVMYLIHDLEAIQ